MGIELIIPIVKLSKASSKASYVQTSSSLSRACFVLWVAAAVPVFQLFYADKIYERMARDCTALSGNRRTVADVREKVKKLNASGQARARKEKRSVKKTGGGRGSLSPSSPNTQMLASLFHERSTVQTSSI